MVGIKKMKKIEMEIEFTHKWQLINVKGMIEK